MNCPIFLILDNRLFYSATQRNRDCIGDVLSRVIKKGSVLEIGSGSGEHGVFFQKRFPGIIWPVVTYAPTAATKPNIAAQPLKRSASGVILLVIIVNKYNIIIY